MNHMDHGFDIGRFWEIVDSVHWEEDALRDVHEMRRGIIRQMEGPEDAQDFRKLYYLLSHKLAQTISTDGLLDRLGSDSFSDLCAHIIGCGEDTYSKTLENPALAVARAKEGDYVESFLDVIPGRIDWIRMSLDHYVVRAMQVIEEYEEVLDDYRYSEEYKTEWARLIEILRLLANDDVFRFMEHEDEARNLSERLLGTSKWAVWNLYTDLRECYPPFVPHPVTP